MGEVCRTCLEESEILYSVLERDEKYNLNYISMLSIITSINFNDNDKLPHSICESCTQTLIIAYNFREQTRNIYDILKASLEDVDVEVEEYKSEHENDESTMITFTDCTENYNVEELKSFKTEYILESVELLNGTELDKLIEENIDYDEFEDPKNDVKIELDDKIEKISELPLVKIKNKANNKIYCDICNRLFKSFQALSHHINLHLSRNDIEETVVKCKFCRCTFKHKIILQCHIQIAHADHKNKVSLCTCCNDTICSNEIRNFICDICNKQFHSHESLIFHLTKKHPEYENLHLHKHQIDEHGSKTCTTKPDTRTICTICGKLFRKPETASLHIRAIHDKETRYKCSECDKKFFFKHGLKMHAVREHSKEKNIKCDFCEKKFYFTCELKVHMRKHVKDDRYYCSDCNKHFTQISEFKYHMDSKHFNERKFKCEHCDKSYFLKNHLKQHMERQHPVGPRIKNISCPYCSVKFYTKNVMKNHAKNVHRKEKDMGLLNL